MKEIYSLLLLVAVTAAAQTGNAPVRTFETRCTICHSGDGTGTDRGPSILGFIGSHSDAEIATLVRTGRVEKGMPRFAFGDGEMDLLLKHLHGLTNGTVQASTGVRRPTGV